MKKRKGARASAFAAALAHAGLGVTLMGGAGTTAWRSDWGRMPLSNRTVGLMEVSGGW